MAGTEQHRRSGPRRSSFATAELSDERAQEIGAARMVARHAHLDALPVFPIAEDTP